MWSLLFIPLGAIVGALSGFFGIGGGVIIVPVLLFGGYTAAEAVATSLLFVVGTSLAGSETAYVARQRLLDDRPPHRTDWCRDGPTVEPARPRLLRCE